VCISRPNRLTKPVHCSAIFDAFGVLYARTDVNSPGPDLKDPLSYIFDVQPTRQNNWTLDTVRNK
jgi:hypothetical protein